ncbi:MAG: DMT family transporter [Anaerolineales bacterium]
MGTWELNRGLPAAAASAVLLGMTPILGKLAILGGLPPLTVVALRTAGATSLLFLVLILFRRQSFYIYPVGLLACFLAGLINGTGSIFYYTGLARIDASLAQLLYSLYPIFVAVLLYLDGYRYTPMTILRIGLSIPAVLLLTSPTASSSDLIGSLMLIAAGLLYALHIPINQRVLYDAPAPTVTFYTLVAMTLVVIPPAFIFRSATASWGEAALWPVAGLTLVTFLSRLSLFTGVKYLGGLDTALIGLGEIVVTLALAFLLLDESLTAAQWIGALLLISAIILLPFDQRERGKLPIGGWLRWLLPHARYTRQPETESTSPLKGEEVDERPRTSPVQD